MWLLTNAYWLEQNWYFVSIRGFCAPSVVSSPGGIHSTSYRTESPELHRYYTHSSLDLTTLCEGGG